MCDVLDHVHRVASQLRREGVGPRDRVAFLARNSVDTVALVLGCWQVGATVVPLSTRYSLCVFQEVAKAMQCSVAVLPAASVDLVPGIQVLALERIPSLQTDVFGSVRFDQLDLDPDQDASIIQTSGSSGRPKGVLHSIGNHLFSAHGSDQVIAFGGSDTWLACLPLYHISGFSLIMRALLHGGSMRCPEPGQRLEQSVRGGVTHVSLVPTQLRRLLCDPAMDVPLQRLQAVLVGGASCPSSWAAAARARGWPLFLTYGSTEAASQVATDSAEALDRCLGASGRVLPYREVCIASDGEVLLRGKTLLKAYWGQDGPENPFDQAGWFHSGDTGRLDRAGRLYITGRKDLMFVSGGENIFPEEIERVLLEIDGIECCVVVSVPHAEWGRRPVAFVKSNAPRAVWREQVERALSVLERFKRPDRLYEWPAQVSVSAKPDRLALQRLALVLSGH